MRLKPTKPVILDLTLELIDNMLIVNAPQEIKEMTKDQVEGTITNILDVDFLEFDDLEVDYLAEDEVRVYRVRH